MSVCIVAAGGTFEKHYDEIAGKLGFGASVLPTVIARSRISQPVRVAPLPLLDSLDMQDADRERILQACIEAPEQRLVIVHGTDTMPETARLLGPARLDKTIVMTGAMIPYEIANSDALFNFGMAFGLAQALPAGVYIAMSGQVFSWDNVQKNRVQGVFETLRP
ncbi:asparaginase|uniref:asparaginase domain-containing protein n=1 Tax=Noviherbaspirillum sp. L7-7A TaxID=2850560 RepID=UPI001C2C7A82|nr:asparaginase domain-containing protein [Noviherbaspirillum sp. L7-7A]MBV0880611.1 asparaginase [Noviherbaspirillum sp. L7-7A]